VAVCAPYNAVSHRRVRRGPLQFGRVFAARSDVAGETAHAAGQGPGTPRTDRDPAGCGTTTVVYWAPGPSRVSHPQPTKRLLVPASHTWAWHLGDLRSARAVADDPG
jgi:hypothetical protein